MLYLMSTTIIPASAEGAWEMFAVSAERAAEIVSTNRFTSAVGHESTAQAMAAALGTEVTMNRITVEPEEGDSFLCFKLNQRPPEGAILDLETLNQLGYSWCVMRYHGPNAEITSAVF